MNVGHENRRIGGLVHLSGKGNGAAVLRGLLGLGLASELAFSLSVISSRKAKGKGNEMENGMDLFISFVGMVSGTFCPFCFYGAVVDNLPPPIPRGKRNKAWME